MSDLLEIQIDNYEGPLDLLIHLIQRNEMNIFDVPISVITEQFVQEVRRMKEMDMEIAADFIHMASYLIYLKSRSLLPRGTTAGEEMSVEEEGFNLAQALIELAYCKDLAVYLKEYADNSGRYLFRREEILIPRQKEGEPYRAEGTVHQLANAFFYILNASEKEEKKVVINSTKRQSDDVKNRTAKIIIERKETLWSDLETVFTDSFDKAVAFSTILTLSKQQIIKSIQDANFNDILMKRLKIVENTADIPGFEEA